MFFFLGGKKHVNLNEKRRTSSSQNKTKKKKNGKKGRARTYQLGKF